MSDRSPLEFVHHAMGDVSPVVPSPGPGIESIDVEVVRPGDRVRVVNVLDAVVPAAKRRDPPAAYPGILGPPGRSGAGHTDVLDGLLVLSVCDLAASHDLDALPDRPDGPAVVDLAGPGARYAPWEPAACAVVSFEADPTADITTVDRSIRTATMTVACDLAVQASGNPVVEIERLATDHHPGLPTVAVVMHAGSEGPLLDTFLAGEPISDSDPTLLTAAQVRDGGVVSGAYDWAALRNPTCLYQHGRLLRRLQADHGSRVNLGGVILGRTYLPGLSEKRHSARLCAEAAREAGADGVIITTFQSGNSQTDTMLTIEACEELGIRTVGIVSETDHGMTDFSPAADCLVSAGNEDDLVPPWTPGRVIGGDDLDPGSLPVLAYLGAMSQLGDGFRTTDRP